MNLLRIFLILLGAVLILGYQNDFTVIQERWEKVYSNDLMTDFSCGVYKSNRTTNALNLTVTMKYAMTIHDMIFVKGYKWLSNEYRLDIVQFQDTIRNVINIKYFDMDRLLHNYTTPPLLWPIQPGVTHHMFNWIPNSTEFPPGFPEGRWKAVLNFTKADRTPFATLSWFFKIEYKVKWFETPKSRKPK